MARRGVAGGAHEGKLGVSGGFTVLVAGLPSATQDLSGTVPLRPSLPASGMPTAGRQKLKAYLSRHARMDASAMAMLATA